MRNVKCLGLLCLALILISSLILMPSSMTDGTSQPLILLSMVQIPKSFTSSPNRKETEEERVERVQKLLRKVMRMKLKIPAGKVHYVDGWGWL